VCFYQSPSTTQHDIIENLLLYSNSNKENKQNTRCILPPNESRNNLVSFESRNGTCALFSASALIHFPNALKDRLIDLASSNVCPSLPIKSTKNETI